MIKKFGYNLNFLDIFSDKRNRVEFAVKENIEKVILVDDILIVLFKSGGNQNVVAVDEKGIQLWRIQDITITDNLSPENGGPYTNISLDKSGSLWCGNWIGEDHRVDPKTGEILEHKYTK